MPVSLIRTFSFAQTAFRDIPKRALVEQDSWAPAAVMAGRWSIAFSLRG
jgi:hypothetical protein